MRPPDNSLILVRLCNTFTSSRSAPKSLSRFSFSVGTLLGYISLMADNSLPSRAKSVIIGGGVGGTSVAFHLAELGERDKEHSSIVISLSLALLKSLKVQLLFLNTTLRPFTSLNLAPTKEQE